MSFEWTRCAASSASLPRKSHLLSGETSQTPTPSRTARYSASGSPNPVTHHHPASSMNPAAVFDMIAWNAVRCSRCSRSRSRSLMAPLITRLNGCSSPRRGSSRPRSRSLHREIEAAGGQSLLQDLQTERDADRERRQAAEEAIVVPPAVADPTPASVERHAGTATTSIDAGSSGVPSAGSRAPNEVVLVGRRGRRRPRRGARPRSSAARPRRRDRGVAGSRSRSGPRTRRGEQHDGLARPDLGELEEAIAPRALPAPLVRRPERIPVVEDRSAGPALRSLQLAALHHAQGVPRRPRCDLRRRPGAR